MLITSPIFTPHLFSKVTLTALYLFSNNNNNNNIARISERATVPRGDSGKVTMNQRKTQDKSCRFSRPYDDRNM